MRMKATLLLALTSLAVFLGAFHSFWGLHKGG